MLRITEVEAYPAGDAANHCRAGRTARNAPMWGPGGHAYVYLCYGVHWMFNVVSGPEGSGEGVLIRGAEVLRGHEVVRTRRGHLGPGSLAGPGKVGQALGADGSWSGTSVRSGARVRLRRAVPPDHVLVGPRVGIGSAGPVAVAAPLRFADGSSDQVSARSSLTTFTPRSS